MLHIHIDRAGRILLLKAEQLSLFGGAGPKRVEKPGSRGGKYYVTDTGRIEYGTKPAPAAPKNRVDAAQAVGHTAPKPKEVQRMERSVIHADVSWNPVSQEWTLLGTPQIELPEGTPIEVRSDTYARTVRGRLGVHEKSPAWREYYVRDAENIPDPMPEPQDGKITLPNLRGHAHTRDWRAGDVVEINGASYKVIGKPKQAGRYSSGITYGVRPVEAKAATEQFKVHGRFQRNQLVTDGTHVYRIASAGVRYHEDATDRVYHARKVAAPKEWAATQAVRQAINDIAYAGDAASRQPIPDAAGPVTATWRDAKPGSLASFPSIEVRGDYVRVVIPRYDDAPIVAWVRDPKRAAQVQAAIAVAPQPFHVERAEVVRVG